MKILWTIFFILMSFWSVGQEQDTALVRVDRLIQQSKEFIDLGDLESAKQVLLETKFKLEASKEESSTDLTLILLELGKLHIEMEDYENAESINLQSRKILENNKKTNSEEYASTLFHLGFIYYQTKKYEQSESNLLKAIAIQKNILGTEDLAYAKSLRILGMLYGTQMQIDNALPLLIEAKNIQISKNNNAHLAYAETVINLGQLYEKMGEYEKAKSLFIEVKMIRAEKLGKLHPEYGAIVKLLAIIYSRTREFESAEPLYLEALAISKNTYGTQHPKYAMDLHHLGILYSETGSYEKSEEYYLKSKKILEDLFGDDFPLKGMVFMNIGVLYDKIAEYEKAEFYFFKVKELWKERRDRSYMMIVTNIANLQRNLGNYSVARDLFLEALDINEIELNHSFWDKITITSNLGYLYIDMEDFSKAEICFKECLQLIENEIGKENSEYTDLTASLAFLYSQQKKLKKSEELYLFAIKYWEKLKAPFNFNYPSALTNLSMVYVEMGEIEKIEPLLLKAAAIEKEYLGENHFSYGNTLNFLADFYYTMGEYEKVRSFVLETSRIKKITSLRAIQHLSEKELMDYRKNKGIVTVNYYTYLTQGIDVTDIVFDDILFYKGFLLNSVKKINNIALSKEETKAQLLLLKSYRRRLANEYSKPLIDRQNVDKLEEKANLLEKELIRTVEGYDEAFRQINWQDVQKELAIDEVAIEFIHYQRLFPTQIDTTIYAAMVIRPGMEKPHFIPLCEERQLSNLQKKQDSPSKFVNDFYAMTPENESLNQLIYQPLKEVLTGIKTIYFAPSGELHRLNLSAIQLDETTTLADQFQLIRMGSTRQLVSKKNQAMVANQDATLFGAIQYDASPLPSEALKKNTTINSVQFTEESISTNFQKRGKSNAFPFTNVDSTLRGGNWQYLKWTEVEVDGIELILEDANMKIAVKKGKDASEEAFKAIGEEGDSPKILHLATHGFFFPDPEKTVNGGRRMDGAHEPVFKISDHPMIRSGLVLAGGNHAWKTGKPIKEGMEDGILTAYEISQMNLSNTELVVLSACETGLGDIEGNEGVYGLQRAFKIAGAKYLIMSLWQVPDFQTQELMTAFYINWLEEKMEIPQAFRAAQKELKERYPLPFSWAGFVLVE